MNYICCYLIIHLNKAGPSIQQASLVAQHERICVQCRRPGLILGSGRSLGEGNGSPLQYASLGNLVDRGAWWGPRSCIRVGHSDQTTDRHNTQKHTVEIKSVMVGVFCHMKAAKRFLKLYFQKQLPGL